MRGDDLSKICFGGGEVMKNRRQSTQLYTRSRISSLSLSLC